MGGAITTALIFLLFFLMVGALGFMFGHLE
jgi:hypothetical protein